jgi:hypothetical protein
MPIECATKAKMITSTPRSPSSRPFRIVFIVSISGAAV